MKPVTALFFATLRDRTGIRSIELEIPPQLNVADFKTLIIGKFPGLADMMGHTLISINHEYVFDEVIIPAGAEIALFPPVSGG